MDARDTTGESGDECGDRTDCEDTPDDGGWRQESASGWAEAKDGCLGGLIDGMATDGAAFALETWNVTRPGELTVVVEATHTTGEISASIDLTPEQAEAFAEVLVEQAEEAREREERSE